jgi:hypothetical protein
MRRLLLLGTALTVILMQSGAALADDPLGNSVRIKRPKDEAEVLCYFKSINAGVANRWWRKFRNPSFCPYVLCSGSCADPVGIPRLGEYSARELASDMTLSQLSLEPLLLPFLAYEWKFGELLDAWMQQCSEVV